MDASTAADVERIAAIFASDLARPETAQPGAEALEAVSELLGGRPHE